MKAFSRIQSKETTLLTFCAPGRTRTYEAMMTADLQSAPFAARDTNAKVRPTNKSTSTLKQVF